MSRRDGSGWRRSQRFKRTSALLEPKCDAVSAGLGLSGEGCFRSNIHSSLICKRRALTRHVCSRMLGPAQHSFHRETVFSIWETLRASPTYDRLSVEAFPSVDPLSPPRVINFKLPLQPHQQYYITQYEELRLGVCTF